MLLFFQSDEIDLAARLPDGKLAPSNGHQLASNRFWCSLNTHAVSNERSGGFECSSNSSGKWLRQSPSCVDLPQLIRERALSLHLKVKLLLERLLLQESCTGPELRRSTFFFGENLNFGRWWKRLKSKPWMFLASASFNDKSDIDCTAGDKRASKP